MNLLTVKVQTPRQILYEGKALAVSSKDSFGNFDILPKHANFIALVQNNPVVIIKEDKQKLTFQTHQAIIHNTQNTVSIYIDPLSTK